MTAARCPSRNAAPPAFLAALAVVALAVGCGDGGDATPPAEDLLTLEQRGVSLLERYDEADQTKALAVLRGVCEKAPQWREARVNYGIALAATNKPEGHAAALAELGAVLAEDPWNPWALFHTALVHRFQGRLDEAVPFLMRLLDVDPDDPGVHYWLGAIEAERAKDDSSVAESHLRRAVELAPNDQSAMYALYLLLSREGKGETDEATRLFERFQGLQEAERFGTGALAKHLKRGQGEYGESGKYAFAIRDLAAPAGAVFSDATAKSGLTATTAAAPGLACGDADGDGDDDLFLADPAADRGILWRNDGGKFADATEGSGLAAAGGNAALFADFDDDGNLDLCVAGDRLRLFRNAGGAGGKIAFEEVPAEKLSAAASKPFRAATWADLDHDGDLDLLLGGPEGAYLRNNRDGTFLDATAERGLSSRDARGFAVFDADGDDRVQDLVVFGPSGPPRLLVNGRLDPFVADARLATLGEAVSGTVGDADGDGLLDLVLVRPDGRVALARGNGSGGYALDPTFPSLQFAASSAAVADFDGDGHPDVLLVGRRVTVLRGLPRGGWRPQGLSLPEADRGALAVSDFDGDGDLDVVLTAPGAAPTVLRNEAPPARHSIRLRLRGVPDRVEGRTFSNVRGIGADVEVKAGDLVARRVVACGAGFPGQGTDEIVVGLGGRPRADWVRVRWTDGVLQSEFDVPADRRHVITEVNRKLASCPVLFAWTGSSSGSGFEYVTDTLGAGGLGFYLGPAIGYAPPDPTEVVRLPRLAPRDGAYVVQMVENLEEVSYLDEAVLVAVDHPAGVVVHADERFASDPPLPRDRFFAARAPIAPVAATDDAGRDVLAKVLADDRDTVDSFPRDRRFLGFAQDHALTLDFGDRLASLKDGDRLILFLSGWIEYGYSKTVYAAAQAGISMAPPVLEVPDGSDGSSGWKRAAGVGYPAGNSRTMTYDVTGILGPASSKFRLRTNLEVYWDRVFLARDAAEDAGAALRVTRVPAASADLHERGYPREYSPDGRGPTLYDYSVCEAWIPFRTIAGSYTRFGDVTPLVTASDDRFAIFGKGEEATLSFRADALPSLPTGWERTFFVRLDGYCKDKDPYTALGNTVDPLPFHAMSNYPYPSSERYPSDAPHREYRARFNTRRLR